MTCRQTTTPADDDASDRGLAVMTASRRMLKRHPWIITPARAWISLQRLDYAAAIDRSFRFIEMLIIVSLLTSVLGIVHGEWQLPVQILGSLTASCYLIIPVASWFTSLGAFRHHRRRRWYIALLTIAHAPLVLLYTDSLSALLLAAVDINAEQTRAKYYQTERVERLMACIHANRDVSYKQMEERCGREQPPMTPSYPG